MDAIVLKVFIDKKTKKQYSVGDRVSIPDPKRLEVLVELGLVKSLEVKTNVRKGKKSTKDKPSET